MWLGPSAVLQLVTLAGCKRLLQKNFQLGDKAGGVILVGQKIYSKS